MENDGNIAKDTLFEPERLRARAIDWDQSDRGQSSGRAAPVLQSRRRIHGRNRHHARINRKALAPREPSIHGSRNMPNGKREVLGVTTGPSEAETFWTEFLRSLADRGLRGVKLVIADDHKGLRAAARRVFNATHQRCRIHWMRNALAHAPAKQRTAVAAMLKTIFAQETKVEAETQWEIVADALREKQPKLGALMDASRDDVLAYMSFPREHWTQIASTNPLERVNREVKRRADVIGIFPNDDAIIRLVGALMLETNDEWAVARRYMSLETLARVTDNPTVRLPAVAA